MNGNTNNDTFNSSNLIYKCDHLLIQFLAVENLMQKNTCQIPEYKIKSYLRKYQEKIDFFQYFSYVC